MDFMPTQRPSDVRVRGSSKAFILELSTSDDDEEQQHDQQDHHLLALRVRVAAKGYWSSF